MKINFRNMRITSLSSLLVLALLALTSCQSLKQKNPQVTWQGSKIITPNRHLPTGDAIQGQVHNDSLAPGSAITSHLIDQEGNRRESRNNNRSVTINKYCYLSCPQNAAPGNLEIIHKNYRLSYNIKTKYADWVAYKISLSNLSGATKARNWRADPNLPKEVALIPADYGDAYSTCGYDRGHQAPLADFSNSEEWQSLNYLSNITPQKAPLNRGSWVALEKRIREVAKKYRGSIYVMTGTYYNDKPTCKLPKARIPNIVPSGYWKIITQVYKDKVYRAAFIFEQDVKPPKYSPVLS